MTTPSSPTPQPGAGPQRKPRGPIDAATLAQLQTDEETILAVKQQMATDPAFTTALGSHFLDAQNTIAITPASVATLAGQASAARQTAGEAVSGTAAHGDITDQEDTRKTDLLASIQNAQARAKEKYEESAPAKLKEYWIGQTLSSRSKIEQAGAAIYDLVRTADNDNNPVTPKDTLPGFDQAKIDLLKTRLDAYTDIQTNQTLAQGGASGARTSFKSQCDQISRRRRKLQLAIDAEYAPGEENAAFRKQFGLQGDRAMS